MKTNRWKIFPFLFALILSSCNLCNEPADPTVLPAETQSGKNTLGCYVDGKMYFGGYYAPFGHRALTAEYHKSSNRLVIDSYGKIISNGIDSTASLCLYVNNIRINSTQKIDSCLYMPGNSDNWIKTGCYMYATVHDGEIVITKLDTLNKIVSGRFSFMGTCSGPSFHIYEESDGVMQISQGRFDLKFELYD